MSMTKEERREAKKAAQREWHHRNYAGIKADPERYARMRAQKNAARARAREQAKQSAPAPVNADLHRTYGPWAPLFALQQAA